MPKGSKGQQPYQLYFAASNKGSKGQSGRGAVLYDPEGNKVWSGCNRSNRETTAPQSNYRAMIHGMHKAREAGAKNLQVKGDVTGTINQMRGTSGVRSDNVKQLHARATKVADDFKNVSYSTVPRSENREAHHIARDARKKW